MIEQNVNKTLKMPTSILLTMLILLTILMTSTANANVPQEAIGWPATLDAGSMPYTTSTTKGYFVSTCCFDEYYITPYSAQWEDTYITIPVKTEIWDKNLNPIVNVTIYSALYHWNNNSKLYTRLAQSAKKTNSQGIVKNGYSILSPTGYTTEMYYHITSISIGTTMSHFKVYTFSISKDPFKR